MVSSELQHHLKAFNSSLLVIPVKTTSTILKEHFFDEEIKSEPKATAIKVLAGLLVIGKGQTKLDKEVDEGGKKTNNTLIQQQ